MGTTALDRTVTSRSLASTAPAKINLTLDVLGRREDGYHELRSLVIGVDLYDRVRCRQWDQAGVDLTCSEPALATGDNLACRAALRLAHRLRREPSLRIEIDKRIPVGGGLGGGSSDAAATLRICNTLWDAGLEPRELAGMGADLGSDVPLFFSLPSAVLSGRGDRVETVAIRWAGWALLAFVDQVVSTPDVYREWRPSDAADASGDSTDVIAAATGAEEICANLSNHLEAAVFRVAPKVARAHEELTRAGVGPVRVSGAGSTLYRLFDEEEAACRAARKIEHLRMGIRTSVVAAPAGPGPIVCEEC